MAVCLKSGLPKCDFIDWINRPRVSACRYWVIAAGPPTARGLPVGSRFSGSKYNTDRKVVVGCPSSGKVARVTSPSGVATAIALLVVPKSKPITLSIGFFVGMRPQGEWEGVWWFSAEPGEIGLTALEGAGDGINQHAKDRLAQLTAGLAQ